MKVSQNSLKKNKLSKKKMANETILLNSNYKAV